MSQSVLRAKLGALRRLVRAAMLAMGVGRFAGAAAALVLLSLALDRAFRLPRSARLVQLCVLGAVLAWEAARHLFLPALRPLPDQALALELEERYPALGDLLASAVHFGMAGPGRRLSSLESVAVARARAAAERLQPRGLIRWRPVAKRALLGGIGAVLIAGLGALRPDMMGLWFGRNVLLSAEDWPRRTHLASLGFRDGVIHVPRGGDVTIRVRASGVIPRVARLKLRGEPSGRVRTLLMERAGEDVFSADLNDLSESASLAVRAGDGLLDRCRIEVVERPAVASARMIVRPPEYISPAPAELLWQAPSFAIPKGSSATVLLETTKPVVSAHWQTDGGGAQPMAQTGPRSLECSFEVLGDMRCTFTFEDTLGIEVERPLVADISAAEDRAPEVTLRASGVGSMLVPDARLPIRVHVSDDYGAEDVWLEQQHQAAGERAGYPPTSLYGGPARAAFRDQRVVELSELDLPARGRLVLTAAARDACTVGGPNTGRSAPLAFRLVTVAELLRALVVQQQDLRRDLEEQIRREKDLRAELARPAESDPDEPARVQRSVAGVLGSIAEGYGAVLDQMLNNGVILQSAYGARAVGIVQALRDLGSTQGAVRRAAAVIQAGQGAVPAGEALALVDAAVAEMEQVRGRMLLLENHASLLASVREISRAQQELLDRTEELGQEVLDALLGGR